MQKKKKRERERGNKRSHLISNLVLFLSQDLFSKWMEARELLARERILFEPSQFLELPLFLLDILSLSSQGLG